MKTIDILKNGLVLLFASILAFGVSGCKDSEDTNDDFHIVVTEIKETPEKLSGSITLSSSDFEFRVIHDWCTVTKEGNVLKVEAGSNYDFLNRTTEIIITSGNITRRIPVTQTGILLEFSNDTKTSFNCNWLGAETVVRILANVDYKVIVPDQYAEWISVEPLADENSYKIVIDPSNKNRDGWVYFEYLEKKLEVYLNQYNYLAYNQMLGEATLSYTDVSGSRIEMPVTITEKEYNKVLAVTGMFGKENPVERTFWITYMADKEGELRIHPAILETPYSDTQDERIKVKIQSLFGRQIGLGNRESDFGVYASSPTYYYPAISTFTPTGNLYTFSHSSEGVPDTSMYKKTTKGFKIAGSYVATGSTANVTYETLQDVTLFKKYAN